MNGRKTDILDLVARKLSPYVILFGFYLISYGHLTPGGGFQGGVVIASGVILLALGRGSESAEKLFPVEALHIIEAGAFLGLLAAGTAGLVLAGSFLSNFLSPGVVSGTPGVFVFFLNIVIGVKVAAGISLICLKMFEGDQ
jgi:multicomponent Na+:H+ antiporter subunit B